MNPGSCAAATAQMRNFLATLAFSQGVPMIAHGDEIARTQDGNNNAYAQDNEIAWMNWDLDEREQGLLAFAQRVFAIRRANPVATPSLLLPRPPGAVGSQGSDVAPARRQGDDGCRLAQQGQPFARHAHSRRSRGRDR